MTISFGGNRNFRPSLGEGTYIDSDVADFIQEDEPAIASEGDTWFKPSSDELYVYYE